MPHQPHIDARHVQWRPPPEEWYVNITMNAELGLFGVGCMVRNNIGEAMEALVNQVRVMMTLQAIELWAI